MPSEATSVRLEDVVKVYRTATGEVRALRGVSASFPTAALIAVAGPSGSGKSSLLRLVAGLDRPTSGSVEVGGVAIASASSHARRRLRRERVGYVFQRPSDNFLPHLTLGEHLARVARDAGDGDVLDALGIADRVDHRPGELSGGEQQRAAFAQALVAGANLVVADEPTAELDTASADAVLSAARALRERAGVTFVFATHDQSIIRAADVVLRLDHGEVVEPRRSTPWAEAVGGSPGTVEPDALVTLRVGSVSKTYARGADLVHAVDGASLEAREGELVGLVGRSGSGKTTLLNLVAGWERADEGWIESPGREGGRPPSWRDLAIVPQRLGLMDELTVRENVAYPALLAGALGELEDRVERLLESLDLAQLAERRPSDTSVGEQQRTAIARALVLRPALLLADEPTGHQDRDRAVEVFAALRAACDEGTTCIVATHDASAGRLMDRTISMRDGRVAGS